MGMVFYVKIVTVKKLYKILVVRLPPLTGGIGRGIGRTNVHAKSMSVKSATDTYLHTIDIILIPSSHA
jgi:hypothetical protein